MPKKRPTESGWDSDEDMLLEDSGAINIFTKKYGNVDEIIDEDALLGIEKDKSKNKSLAGEGFELFIDEKEMGTFDDTAESQELDYEDTYQDEEVSQDLMENEMDLLVVNETPNATITKIQHVKPAVFGAKTGESDNSDSDEDKKSRERFKTERTDTIILKTPLFKKAAAIPDNLEVTKEMQEEIDNFNQQQGKKGKQKKNFNNKRGQQHHQLQQQQRPPFQNNIHPVRSIGHQQHFQRGPRPQGNNPRHRGMRFNHPGHFGPRGHQQNFNPRPRQPLDQMNNNSNSHQPMQPGQERGPVPLFPHEMRNPHSSPGPHNHAPPTLYEQAPHSQGHPQGQPQGHPQGQVPPFNHGPPQGQPPVPFSPPPPNSQPPAVHVNPNFTGPIPQEAFNYPQHTQSYQPAGHPNPPYPISSQSGPGPQHYHQPGMPPHSVQQQQQQQPPQQQPFNPPPQHFQHQPQQGFPPHGPPNTPQRMNFPSHQSPQHQGPPQHQPRPMGMPRSPLIPESPGPRPRPGFAPQHRPEQPSHRMGQPRPLIQTGPRPHVPQQHQQQQHQIRGPPPRHIHQQQPSHKPPNQMGQQIPARFQGQNQPRHQNNQHMQQQQRFQGPRGPAPGPLQQTGGFNPTPDQFTPMKTEEEQQREEQEQLQKLREMEEKKRRRAERFSKNEPVEVATTSGNLKVIKTTTKIGEKRPSTSNLTEISPAKIIRIEQRSLDSNADADLQAKLEKQKMIREKIQRQKEARRQAEAESRRQKLSEKLALEGKSIEDLEKEQREEEMTKKLQGQLKEQQEIYQLKKQQQQLEQQQEKGAFNKQQSAGGQGHMPQGQSNQGWGRGHIPQGQQNQGWGRGHMPQGQPNQGRGRGHMPQGQPNLGRGRGHMPQGQPNLGRGRGHMPQGHLQMGRGNQGGLTGPGPQNMGQGHIQQGQGNQAGRGRGKTLGGQNTGQGQNINKQKQSAQTFNKPNQTSGNRTVLAQGMTKMGAASQRTVTNKDNLNRTVVPSGSERRIVLESTSTQKSTVSIEGLSLKPDLGKINGFCSNVGTVESFNYKSEERRVVVKFANSVQAAQFVKKYDRQMIDLTHIKVRLIPNI